MHKKWSFAKKIKQKRIIKQNLRKNRSGSKILLANRKCEC
jgi:hypothetical protein